MGLFVIAPLMAGKADTRHRFGPFAVELGLFQALAESIVDIEADLVARGAGQVLHGDGGHRVVMVDGVVQGGIDRGIGIAIVGDVAGGGPVLPLPAVHLPPEAQIGCIRQWLRSHSHASIPPA